MVGEDIHFVVVFQQEGPIFGLDGRGLLRGLDDVLVVERFFLDPFLFDELFLAFVLGHDC